VASAARFAVPYGADEDDDVRVDLVRARDVGRVGDVGVCGSHRGDCLLGVCWGAARSEDSDARARVEERTQSIPVLGTVRGEELRDDVQRHVEILVYGVPSRKGRGAFDDAGQAFTLPPSTWTLPRRT
jgi:hypothetical protein